MRYSYNDILGMSQDVFWMIMFIAIVLFVFMIYVGICVIIIKGDIRQLADLEFRKYKEEKERESNNNITGYEAK